MTRIRTYAIEVEGSDVQVTIETEGDAEKDAEKVHLHAHDQAVRAMQALRDGTTPDEAEGIGISIDFGHEPPTARDDSAEPDYTCQYCGRGFYAADYDTGKKGAQTAKAGHVSAHPPEERTVNGGDD